MLLTCDIGNSLIKTALFDKHKILDLNNFAGSDLLIEYILSERPSQIAIASVVPEKTSKISSVFDKSGFDYLVINSDLNFNLEIDYETPGLLGIDRLCSAEGAFFLFKNSDDFKTFDKKSFIISIDFGTATTINFVKYSGIFMGGIIAPGINMMFSSLKENTAQLPLVDHIHYRNLIGEDTNSSIASGVINSTCGLIEKSVKHLEEKYEAKIVKVYVTGGNAHKIINHLKIEFEYVKELVLIGIKEIYLKNKL